MIVVAIAPFILLFKQTSTTVALHIYEEVVRQHIKTFFIA